MPSKPQRPLFTTLAARPVRLYILYSLQSEIITIRHFPYRHLDTARAIYYAWVWVNRVSKVNMKSDQELQVAAIKESVSAPSNTRSGVLSRDFLLHVFFKRLPFIVVFFLLVAGTAVGVGRYAIERKYEATAQVLFQPGREHITIPELTTAAGMNPGTGFDPNEQVGFAAEVLTGWTLIEKVVNELGPFVIYPDLQDQPTSFLHGIFQHDATPIAKNDTFPVTLAVSRLQNDISVVAKRQAPIIEVTVVNVNPQVAADVVNRLIVLYVDRYLLLHKNARLAQFFKDQMRTSQARVDQSTSRLAAFKQEHGVSSTLVDSKAALTKRIELLQRTHDETTRKIWTLQQQNDILRNQLARFGRAQAANPDTGNSLIAKLASLEIQEGKFSNMYTDEHPKLIELRKEIGFIRARISQVQKRKQDEELASGNASLSTRIQEQLLQVEIDLSASRSALQKLNIEFADLEGKLIELDQISTEFDNLQQQAKIDRDNYKLYRTRSEESQINDTMDAEKIAGIRVLEEARPPDRPRRSKSRLIVASGVALGAFGALILALLLEIFQGLCEIEVDVERTLGLTVLASITES
jgi:uncharacterized protein involved in exopolysaccharide biosynthesis